MLSRDQILQAVDLPREKVLVPEWGGEVWVRTLTGAERDKFEADNVVTRGKTVSANLANIRARLAVLTVCDEAGQRVFQDADAAALGRTSARALERIADVARRLNGLTEEVVGELEKNSEPGPS